VSRERRQPVPGLPPLGETFPDVRRIAVLRGGGIGDLVFALPAIAALRASYPGASVTLLGSPSHRALLAGRPDVVDEIDVLPVVPGVGDASGTEIDGVATDAFVERHRSRRYDLAVQVHGGGRNSNPFLLRLGARHTVGTRTSDAAPLERTIPYVYYQHEVLRALEVVGLAGAAHPGGAVLTPTPAELERGAELVGRAPSGDDGRPVVAIHPGASDPRRRWSADRFGRLAARLAQHGVRVLVVGDGDDVALAERIVAVAVDPVPSDRWPGVSASRTSSGCWPRWTSSSPTTAARGTWPRPWGRRPARSSGSATSSTPVRSVGRTTASRWPS
jgi:ADP-heptose:LPS heptosyltransferase